MASAVLTGTVLFSTMILLLVDTLAIMRAAPSQYARSAAFPAPTPVILVGVFTLRSRAGTLLVASVQRKDQDCSRKRRTMTVGYLRNSLLQHDDGVYMTL